ncbi:MAG: crossover junction endodeoxyribonuclease RuvC [Aquisalinus sp.]|nr:crossover junction endodeoxyribonuclease RuvC [Aquisalinus sp.]
MSRPIRILGIDPGLRCAGWGLIETSSGRLTFVESGTIKPDTAQELAYRLADLHKALQQLIERLAPDMAAVEETFVNSNPRAALTLGQARGVCLAAPAIAGVPVAEYPANTIKKSVVGVGHAGKEQVQAMIRVLLPMSGKQGADAADALAVAICHAHHAEFTHRRSA